MAYKPKTCPCGKTFTPATPRAKYCSKACRAKGEREKNAVRVKRYRSKKLVDGSTPLGPEGEAA